MNDAREGFKVGYSSIVVVAYSLEERYQQLVIQSGMNKVVRLDKNMAL